MKTLLALVLLTFAAHGAKPRKPGPIKAEPTLTVVVTEDTAVVRGKKVTLPGPTYFNWVNEKGDTLRWDASSGQVVKGDSEVTMQDFRTLAGLSVNQIESLSRYIRARDSVVSDYLNKSWTVLHPQRQ